MKKIILFFFGLFIFSALQSQSKRANIWYFGYKAGLDFNTNPPSILNDGQINTIEGSSCISDTNGKILFYTDGKTVYNKNHFSMPNGSSLSGNSSSTQATIIIPQPMNDSLVFIFTNGIGSYKNNIYYSIVNLNLENGLGDVISKNNLLFAGASEKMAATMHQNGIYVWLTIHEYGTDNYISYLITENGIPQCPYIQSQGSVYTKIGDSGGMLKFNSKGSTIAVACRVEMIAEVLDFDNLTGTIKHKKTLNFNDGPYGVEFNNSNNFLYIYGSNVKSNLYKIRLNDYFDTIIYKRTSGASGQIQIANDNQIYIASSGKSYLSKIDSIGNYIDSALFLNGSLSSYGLPNFISNDFSISEPPFFYLTNGDTIYTYSKESNKVSKWLFFNDSILIDSSQILNSKFIMKNSGYYTIKLITISNDTFERKVLKNFRILNYSDTIFCDKDSIELLSNKKFHCVYWQDTLCVQNLWVNKSGTYRVRGIDCYGNIIIDSINLMLLKTPRLDLGKDTAFCNNTNYILKGDTGYKYIWSTGDTSSSIIVNKSGVYFLTEKNGICQTTDTIKLDILPIPQPILSKSGNLLNVKPAYTNFQWYKDQQPLIGAKASQYIAVSTGHYYVIVNDSNGCDGSSDTVGVNTGMQTVKEIEPYIYPNPVNDNLYIEFSPEFQWQLLDVTGNKILEGNKNIVDMKDLPNNIYILKITSKIQSSTYKIIKQ